MPDPGKLNIKKFAKLCGLSVGTVSGIINKKPGFNADTIAFVEEKMRQYQYRPNPYARRMQEQRIGAIGIFCDSDQTMFKSYVLKELIQFLRRNGYNAIVHYLDLDEEFDISAVAADAYVLLGNFKHIADQVQRYHLHGAMLDVQSETLPQMRCLNFDRARAHVELCAYLYDRGHREFAYIGARSTKYDEYTAALKQRGLELAAYAETATPAHARQLFEYAQKPGHHLACFIPYEGHVLQFAMQCQAYGIEPGKDISALTWGMSYKELLPEADFTRIGVFNDAVGRAVLEALLEEPIQRTQHIQLPLIFHNGKSVATLL